MFGYRSGGTMCLHRTLVCVVVVALRFDFIDNGFECFGIVGCEVGKCLAVDLDACLVYGTHEL